MIILDERKTYIKGTCGNCNNFSEGRLVEELDFITRQRRDSPFVCFNCHGPRIHWKKRQDSKTIISPVKRKKL